jgi:hypothetical protein
MKITLHSVMIAIAFVTELYLHLLHIHMRVATMTVHRSRCLGHYLWQPLGDFESVSSAFCCPLAW